MLPGIGIVTVPEPEPVVRTGCEAADVEVVVTAPPDREVFLDSPTLPLSRRQIAAGGTLHTTIADVAAGVHVISVSDHDGRVLIANNPPIVVLPGERHQWKVAPEATAYATPTQQIDRCGPEGVRRPLQGPVALTALTVGPPLLAGDGRVLARRITQVSAGMMKTMLAVAAPGGPMRQLPLISGPAEDPQIDTEKLAQADELLRTGDFARLTDALPVADFSLQATGLRAQWHGQVGVVEVPSVPADVDAACCGWVVEEAFTCTAAEAVFGGLRLECTPACAAEAESPAAVTHAVVAIALDQPVADATPRYRVAGPAFAREVSRDLAEHQTLVVSEFLVGPFGPGPDGVLVLLEDGEAHGLGGFLHTERDGKNWRVPVPEDVPPWSLRGPPTLWFEDVDGDGHDEALVLTVNSDASRPKFYYTHVWKWDDERMIRLTDVERKIGPRKTISAVQAALARHQRTL